mgnify:CR=1 FL=1
MYTRKKRESAKTVAKELDKFDDPLLMESIEPAGAVTIRDLNLEQELVEQYVKTKELMRDTFANEDMEGTKKATVCNALVAVLRQLVALQEDLKLQQSLKLMEHVLIDVIKILPQATKDEFFKTYEQMAKREGLL